MIEGILRDKLPERMVASLVLVCLFVVGWQSVLRAHHLNVREVLEALNREDNKKRTGVVEVSTDKKVPRLLLIRVGPEWYRLTAPERQRLAVQWLKMWKDAVPKGIVAVLDAVTDEPVVNYHSSGKVTLSGGKASP